MKNTFKKPLFYLSVVLVFMLGFFAYNFVLAQNLNQPSSSDGSDLTDGSNESSQSGGFVGPSSEFPFGNPSMPLTTDYLSDPDGELDFTGPDENSGEVFNFNPGHYINFDGSKLLSDSFGGITLLNGNFRRAGNGVSVLHGHKITARDFSTDNNNNPNQYGYFEVKNSNEVRGAYFGHGNGADQVDLRLDKASTLNISGGNLDMNDNNITNVSKINGENVDFGGGGDSPWSESNGTVFYDGNAAVDGEIQTSDGTDQGEVEFRADRGDCRIYEGSHVLNTECATGVAVDFDSNGNGNGNGFQVYENGNERFRVDLGGNVGIGESNPEYKLDVNGIVKGNHFRDADNTDYYVNPDGNSRLNEINGTPVSKLGNALAGYEVKSKSEKITRNEDGVPVETSCSAGKKVISGSCSYYEPEDYAIEVRELKSHPTENGDGWVCSMVTNMTGKEITVTNHAICLGDKTPGEVCEAAGGQMVDSSGANTSNDDQYAFCKFSRSSCPIDWSQKENWTTTSDITCGDSNCETTDLDGHSWSNQVPESTADFEIYDPEFGTCLPGGSCSAPVDEIGCVRN